jgi:hypothetical protein
LTNHDSRIPQYQKNSLSLTGAVALGTGVMIGAGIFSLTNGISLSDHDRLRAVSINSKPTWGPAEAVRGGFDREEVKSCPKL